ncbi:MAG: class I SAM-dependent methyltransferase [Bacteroidales bacterium]|nr:class I SAM-dependent methyltransferase [Bacteroidales bacterium]
MKIPGKKLIPFWLGKKLRGGWQKYLSIKYRGSDYYCPYCGYSFAKFLPGGIDVPVLKDKEVIGGGFRVNMLCPRCFSVDRDRLIYLFMEEQTNLFSAPLKVLHIAPEGCIRALLMSLPNIEYRSGVKYYEGYYYDRSVNLMDVTSLPFDDASFDVIICNHVLEHIDDDRKAMLEIHRILKPGAWAILQVPISLKLEETYYDPSIKTPEEREKAFGQFDHVRIYGLDYGKLLERQGFTVRRYSPYDDDHNRDELKKYALNHKELLYVAYK